MCEVNPIPYGRHVRLRLLAAFLTLLLAAGFCSRAALACPAYPGVHELADDAGRTLKIRAHGDEFFSYITDTEGNLLYRDETGRYYYVVADGNGFALGALALGGDRLLHAQSDAPAPVNINGEGADFRRKLEAFYARTSANTESSGLNAAGGSPLEGYVPQDGVDPLFGKWVKAGSGFTQPNMPDKGRVCPLLVLKIQYTDVECLFTDEQWHDRVFGSGGVSGYYNEVSNNRFTYVPAAESDGTPSDGVITVTLPIAHPLFEERGTGYNYDRGAKADLYTSSDGHKYAIYGTASLYAYGLEAASAYIDFSQYDQRNDDFYNGNGDGYVSPTELAVLVVNAGYEMSYGLSGVGDPTTWASSWIANNWWNPNGSGGDTVGTNGGILLNGVMLYKYTIMGENLCGSAGNAEAMESGRVYDYTKTPAQNEALRQYPHQGTVGTACHELGHDLGLQDLYDTSGNPAQEREVAALSLMASGSWGYDYNDDPGSSPSHLDAYSKLRLGFYTARTVSAPGAYLVTEAANSAGYNILRVDTDDPDVYYLIENRTFSGFDGGMFLSFYPPGGAIYWRIDEAVVRQKYKNNTVNNEPGHYGIMPEYVYYKYDPYGDPYGYCKPYRNSKTYADYPAQREFVLPEKPRLALSCFDAEAPIMNVWLRAVSASSSSAVVGAGNYAGNVYNAAFSIGANGAPVCTVQASCEKLVSVTVDGAQLRRDADYTVECGSTIITFTPAYLALLKDGEHSLRVQFTDGRYDGAFTTPFATSLTTAAAPEVPATGDAPPLARLIERLWLRGMSNE